MANDIDLSHIDKQVEQNTANATESRRQAQNLRITADQKRQSDDPTGAAYYEKEALRFDQQAVDYENENEQLEAQRQRDQQQIAALETERQQENDQHAARINEIDKQLAQLRGTSALL